MNTYLCRLSFLPLVLLLVLPVSIFSQAKPVADSLNRSDPRSAVTSFLQACRRDNYELASQYLDLRNIKEASRTSEGPQLARQLEAILNSDGAFDVFRLSQSPDGNLADSDNPAIEQVASLTRYGKPFAIELERVGLQPGSQVWLFSQSTVAAIPSLKPGNSTSAIQARLPSFLITITLLKTPIWKWIALLIAAVGMVILFGLATRLFPFLLRTFHIGSATAGHKSWMEPLLQPWLVFMAALAFGVVEQFIDPSALSRLYVGRVILLVVVWAFAWCFINLVELFLTRIDSLLDPRQRIVSHSLIYMGKRAAKVAIAVVAIIIVLDNWGYNMTTIIAGLGVGGIAVALAAQSTIANVFGGVSVIADHPVTVGDFGNFGGILGTVEDIGLRSTRVRTLSRTIMSIPNSSFAGMNLENYGSRDKMLFNPTLQIKRGTPKGKITQLINSIEDNLKERQDVEVGPSPIRLTSLTATAIPLEIFAYVLTPDINRFYKVEADLLLDLDSTLTSLCIELV